MPVVVRAADLSTLIPGLDPATGTYLAAGLGIAVVLVISRGLARRTRLPYPVFLLLAGALASLVPHMGEIDLSPRVVFLGFLPPLIYHAGIVTSPRELRSHAVPIGLGALGLVLATTFAVAGVVWAILPPLGWAGAFVLGSVVAPTDPVAATSVLKRLGAPPRVTAILEGESLVNDGVALALFTIGVAAVATPSNVGEGFLAFVRVAGGGTAFGLVVGWLAARVRRPFRDPSSQIVVSLLIPFVAYLPADALGLSGVLATLATGLVLGQEPVSVLGPSGRIRMAEFWDVLVFLLESVLFVLVGLQLRRLFEGVRSYPVGDVVWVAALTVVVVIVVRLLWWAALPTLRWRSGGRLVDVGGIRLSERLVLGWGGLRGAISLAAALSIPAAVSGHVFEGRDLVVFATFCVIVVTLVGQGTTFPWLLRRLRLVGSVAEEEQRALAERRCAEGALRVLDELVAGDQVSDEVAEWLRERYERRLEQARAEGRVAERPQAPLSFADAERRLLGTQRKILEDLHRSGEITYAVVQQVRRALDLEHARRDL